MRNIRLLLEYDGTQYGGWQRQKNSVTIQQRLEESIYSITGEHAEAVGCSRTDAGVHAKGFVCNFHTSCGIPENKVRDALNSKLPVDIRVLLSEEASVEFHSRYCSKGKTYSYTIINRDISPVIYRNYACHIKQKLNVEEMSRAAQYLVGKHDFAAFRNTGSSVKTSVRTITQLDVTCEGEYIKLYGTADGFLYNMMRIIAGTLIEVGIGKRKAWELAGILNSGDRTKAGKSAPPQGLCLEKVYY
ncbi:MAG: tRNA pseudouridine(38-40) synthase TruA [Bacillota bacterium]|nr:tRNA pseudouridine(38-40) synthase TruA [Bacillota bacterium]